MLRGCRIITEEGKKAGRGRGGVRRAWKGRGGKGEQGIGREDKKVRMSEMKWVTIGREGKGARKKG